MATRNRRNLFTKVRHITGRGRTAKSQPCLTGRRPIPAPPSQIKSIAHTTYCPRATGGPLAYRRKNVHALQDTTSRPWERDPSRFHPLGNQVSRAKVQTIKKQMTPHEDHTGEAYVYSLLSTRCKDEPLSSFPVFNYVTHLSRSVITQKRTC